MNSNAFYKWNKEFLEAGKKRLHGGTVREAKSSGVAVRVNEREAPGNYEVKFDGASLAVQHMVQKAGLVTGRPRGGPRTTLISR